MNHMVLESLLATLRAAGVVSAEVPMADGPLRVVFAPDVTSPLPPGDPTTPGGWKSPGRLDADPLADERSTP